MEKSHWLEAHDVYTRSSKAIGYLRARKDLRMTMYVKMCGDRHEREVDFDSPGSPLIIVSETDNAAVAQFREYAISMLFVTAILWGVKLTTPVGHYV